MQAGPDHAGQIGRQRHVKAQGQRLVDRLRPAARAAKRQRGATEHHQRQHGQQDKREHRAEG